MERMSIRGLPGSVLLLSVWLAGGAQSASSEVEYTGDGIPSGIEEAIRWRVNRGRFDSAAENQLRGTAYADIPATAGPLAPNQSLTLAGRHHSEDLATHNLFQHATVPGSAYYDAASQPEPWDRMAAEGYSWSRAAENIAAGYSGAEAAYLGWWNSTGHRKNLLNSALREIGVGHFFAASSAYRNYYTMALGSLGKTHYFTDTLFFDANGNSVYDSGEGVAGVSLALIVDGARAEFHDISTVVGSFAIPLETMAAGATVQIVISNTTAARISISVPRGFAALDVIKLGAREAQGVGSFQQVDGAQCGFA
jgi:hypothetical protein